LAGLYLGLGQLAPSASGQGATTATSAFTSHLIAGLSNPTGSNSTLPTHFSESVSGVISGFTEPIGHGTGSITLAANHLGNAVILGTEADPGNAGVAFGFLGLLLYPIVVWRAFRAMYRLAAHRQEAVAIAALGAAVITLFQWLNGTLYSVTWLFWLTLGWADRQSLDEFLDLTGSELARVSPA
jgi:hypothetical protein